MFSILRTISVAAARTTVFWDDRRRRNPIEVRPAASPHLLHWRKTITKARKADIIAAARPTSLDDDLPFTYSEEDSVSYFFNVRAHQNGLDHGTCPTHPACVVSTIMASWPCRLKSIIKLDAIVFASRYYFAHPEIELLVTFVVGRKRTTHLCCRCQRNRL